MMTMKGGGRASSKQLLIFLTFNVFLVKIKISNTEYAYFITVYSLDWFALLSIVMGGGDKKFRTLEPYLFYVLNLTEVICSEKTNHFRQFLNLD